MKLFVAVEDKCRYRLPCVIRGWKVSQLNNTDARYVLLAIQKKAPGRKVGLIGCV